MGYRGIKQLIPGSMPGVYFFRGANRLKLSGAFFLCVENSWICFLSSFQLMKVCTPTSTLPFLFPTRRIGTDQFSSWISSGLFLCIKFSRYQTFKPYWPWTLWYLVEKIPPILTSRPISVGFFFLPFQKDWINFLQMTVYVTGIELALPQCSISSFTFLGDSAVFSGVLGRPSTGADWIIVDQSRRTWQLIWDTIHAVDEFVTNLLVIMSEETVGSWTTFGWLWFLCNKYTSSG